MNVSYKTSSGISLIPIEDERMMRHREIYLTGDISSNTALVFFQQVMTLISEDNTLPIKVFISSHGGEIGCGLQIIDIIESCPAPIYTISLDKCFSMAAVILACGAKRFVFKDSEVMLHEPKVLTGNISGNASSINSISQALYEKKKRIVDILSAHTKRSQKHIESDIGYDHFFLTAEECVSFGLADIIIHSLSEINKEVF